MQLPETVVKSETTCEIVDENATAKVKRRPFGSALRGRLSNIVSMYVPSTSNGGSHTETEIDEHTELLSGTDNKSDVVTNKATEELYVIRLTYAGDILNKCITNAANATSFLSKGRTPTISAIAADNHTIYLCMESIPYVFLLKTPDSIPPETANGQLNHSPVDTNPIKGFIRLTVPGVGDLIPHELCVHSPTSETRILYAVGWVLPADSNKSTEKKQWLLARFSLSGQYLTRTRIYPYQRYSGLTVDSTDGKLLLACPILSNECNSNENGVSKELSENSVGQLCKLTSGFERRVFSITMGNEMAIYRPDYVAEESAGHCCWASVQRNSRGSHASKENGHDSTGIISVSRRLFAFPGRQLEGADKQSPRQWLHVVSWDFADLNPGRIAAFDADRLLVVDATTGTLSYITWPDNCAKPTLHRITRPSSKSIQLICSDYHANAPHAPRAYFVSGSNVYSFQFNQSVKAVS